VTLSIPDYEGLSQHSIGSSDVGTEAAPSFLERSAHTHDLDSVKEMNMPDVSAHVNLVRKSLFQHNDTEKINLGGILHRQNRNDAILMVMNIRSRVVWKENVEWFAKIPWKN